MKKWFSFAISLALAGAAAAEPKEINGHWVHEHPTQNRALLHAASSKNISYHGGSILNAAKVVPIYRAPTGAAGRARTSARP